MINLALHSLATKLAAQLLLLTAGLVILSSCTSNLAAPTDTENYRSALVAVTAFERDLIAFRHDLHRHPELAGNEKRTSFKVAEKLQALGYDVRTGVGGYGVVAVLKGKFDGPLVAFRADMDAVAGKALDPVPYRSVVENVHHTCGHDVHTTIGLGLAHGFSAIQETLAGSVMLIFQPAEEAGTGAESMLDAAIFEKHTPDAIYAVHATPFDVGQVAVMPNGMLAGRTRIEVALDGSGDLQAATASVRNVLAEVGDVTHKTMLSWHAGPFIFVDLDPQSPAVNRQAKVGGFVMARKADRARANAALQKAISSLDFDDVDVSLRLTQALEGVNNDRQLVVRTSLAINQHAPELSLLPVPGVIPAFSEDFGSFQRSVPGVMYFVGVNNPETGTVGFPHSPDFVADDGAILSGTKAMLAAMLETLSTTKL